MLNKCLVMIWMLFVAIFLVISPVASAGQGEEATDFGNGELSHVHTPGAYADSDKFTFSVWVNIADFDFANTGQVIHIAGGNSQNFSERFAVGINFLGQLGVRAANEDGEQVLGVRTGQIITAGTWHHILISVDLFKGFNNKGVRVYVDVVKRGLTALGTPTFVRGEIIDFDTKNTVNNTIEEYQLGKSFGFGNWRAYVSETWLDMGTWMDLDITMNRRKFIDSVGDPVDLGMSGEAPTGSAPEIYLPDGHSQWGTGACFPLNCNWLVPGPLGVTLLHLWCIC